jgi:hypothetical protein
VGDAAREGADDPDDEDDPDGDDEGESDDEGEADDKGEADDEDEELSPEDAAEYEGTIADLVALTGLSRETIEALDEDELDAAIARETPVGQDDETALDNETASGDEIDSGDETDSGDEVAPEELQAVIQPAADATTK